MDDKVLDRIQKLIALSGSPEEEEARTSALLACRLILEHRLIVARHTHSKPIDYEPSSSDSGPTTGGTGTAWGPGWDWVPPRRPARPAPPRPPPRPHKPASPLRIVVMCAAQCDVCGRKVDLSEEAWLHGSRVIHTGCLK